MLNIIIICGIHTPGYAMIATNYAMGCAPSQWEIFTLSGTAFEVGMRHCPNELPLYMIGVCLMKQQIER